jgi:hypothetical protein
LVKAGKVGSESENERKLGWARKDGVVEIYRGGGFRFFEDIPESNGRHNLFFLLLPQSQLRVEPRLFRQEPHHPT